MASEHKISAKELEEIFEDWEDPIKRKRRELEKKRERIKKEKRKDVGL